MVLHIHEVFNSQIVMKLTGGFEVLHCSGYTLRPHYNAVVGVHRKKSAL